MESGYAPLKVSFRIWLYSAPCHVQRDTAHHKRLKPVGLPLIICSLLNARICGPYRKLDWTKQIIMPNLECSMSNLHCLVTEVQSRQRDNQHFRHPIHMNSVKEEIEVNKSRFQGSWTTCIMTVGFPTLAVELLPCQLSPKCLRPITPT
jgi:hypothetical protein